MTYTLLAKDVTGTMYTNALKECELYLAHRSRVSDVLQDKLQRANLTLAPLPGDVANLSIGRAIAREKSYSGGATSTAWSTPMPVSDMHVEVSRTSHFWSNMTDNPHGTMSRILESCAYRGEQLRRYLAQSTYQKVDDYTHVVEFVVNNPNAVASVHCVRLILRVSDSQYAPAWVGTSFGFVHEILSRSLAAAGVSLNTSGQAGLLVSSAETQFLPAMTPTPLTRQEFVDLVHGQGGYGDVSLSGRDIGYQARELAMCRGFTPEAFHITPEGYTGPENFENNPALKFFVISVLYFKNQGYFTGSSSLAVSGYGTEKKRDARLAVLSASGNKAVKTQLGRKKEGTHVESWAKVVQRALPDLTKDQVILTCHNVLQNIQKMPSDFHLQVFGGSPDRVRTILSPYVVKTATPSESVATS